MRIHLLLMMFAVLMSNYVLSQQKRTVSGNVKDETGAGLAGVSVAAKGGTALTATDGDGHFSVSLSPSQNVLVFSSVGFETQEVNVASQSTINVVLKSAIKENEVVVVTALGVVKQKRQLGFSITNVQGAELSKTNEVNPINALQGRVAGVQIDMGGAGGLMANSKIVIRGNSTLGSNNQPIFVIDGVIMDNDVFNGTGRDFGNDLKNLNMDDFESVSVLKGSAAAALYGTRAINGVILITTKKGKARKGIGVSVNQSITVTDPYAGPDFQNEFGGGTVGAFFTDNRDPNYKANEAWTTKVFPTDPITGEQYIDRQINRELENWGPRMLGQQVRNYDGTMTTYSPKPNNFLDAFQTGMGYNTNVAVEGGSEKTTFRLSYNKNQADGVVSNNSLKKNAFDLRVTHKLTKFLDIDFTAAYTDFVGKNPPRLGGLDAFASYNFGKLFSWMLPRNYDTKYWMQRENYVSKLGGAPDPTNQNETNKAPESRFWFSLFENNYVQREQLLRSRLAVNLTLTSWAKLVLEGNINNIYTKNETKELGQGTNFSGGAYGLGFQNKQSNFLKWMLMFNKDISPDFTFNGYVGGEAQFYKTDYENSTTDGGLIYPGNFFLANSKNPQITRAGVLNRKKFNSLYASADFGYKNMLFLQATFRNDWSSALTYTSDTLKSNNSYNYPAVSLSWIFTETFKRSLPSWITYGKLRANVAALGGDTDPYTLNPGFVFTDYSYGNGQTVPQSTYSSSGKLQPNIKPQNKISREVGVEMRFLENRLGLDVSVYQDNTKNQILRIGAPFESGIDNILINAGNIQNRGIEISLDATPVRNKNFSWTSAINYAVNRNKIVELYQGITEFNLNANVAEISTWAVVGKSYGVLRSQIESNKFQAVDANGKPVADARNGLPILTWRSDSRTAFPKRSGRWQDIGDINAKFRAGWDNTFTYKNFSLNILVDAKIGGDYVAASYRWGTHTGVFPNTLTGRDAEHGGIQWTSQYSNDLGTYDDGVIPKGVFGEGTVVDKPGGGTADVSGMTYQEAYDQKLIEPSHLPQFSYRYGSSSTGVSDFWVLKNSWVSLRQVALSYSFPAKWYSKLKLNNLALSAVGRNLVYLYQSLPYNFNPESNNSNNTASSGEDGFLPKTRTLTFTLRATF